MKWFLRVSLAVLALWVLWVGWQRFFVSEETRIKRLISAMARAVEQNKILPLADSIAADYSDDRGLDKATLLGVVRTTRSQYEAMFIYISGMVIEMDADRQKAQATLVARILTKRAGGGSTELNAERVRLFFRKTDSGWKMTRVESPELKFE